MVTPMNLNFTFTFDQTNVILAALGKQSFETVAPIIDTIRQQAQPQLNAAEGISDPTSEV
jgi:hypothetical protein